jgi:hypothetical protein
MALFSYLISNPTWARVRRPIPVITPWSFPLSRVTGDPEILDLLPATIAADRVALVGMHDWTDPTLPAIADEWGLTVFDPDALPSDTAPGRLAPPEWRHKGGHSL